MSIENKRNEFRAWAQITVQNNTTIDGYIESLERDIPEYLNMESIFSIDNINEINVLHSRCGVDGDLYEFSRNIGNGRPQASLGKYRKYLQYSHVRESMTKYENTPNDFDLNGAHWYFIVSNNQKEYPVKAICRHVVSSLGLRDDFTTNQAKSALRGVFPQNTIDFIDRNNQGNLVVKDNLENDEYSYSKIKNIILYGSPGVGKTHNTKKLISLIESGKLEKEIFETIKNNELNNGIDIDDIKDRVKFITFHQSFGYEDFIEGFRPNEDGDIQLQDGIFKTICNDADNNRDSNFYLVIDEINRGNISKIFGELITLIEEDKRDTLEVTLPYSKKPFKIPSNLYIIGTMNSTDKSIALIDIALRRRFTFLKMEPNMDLVKHEKAKAIMQQLNEKITDTLGSDYVLGHSYFMKIENDDDLDFVLEYKIKPLLEEYFYGDEQGLKSMMEIVKYDGDDDTE